MKFSTLFIALIVLTLSANAQVRSDFDKDVDFTKFKTIQFAGWQEDSGDQISDLDKERIYDAFRNALTAKGFELVTENADLALTFFLVVKRETSTTAYTDYYGGAGFGAYGRAGWGWGNGHSTTTYTESDYLVGTFVVDFYDVETKKLVWQGVSTNTVTENPKKRAKKTPKRVEKLLKNFPPEK